MEEEDYQVVVPETSFPISDQQMADLENQCNPLQEDDTWCKYISGLFKNSVFYDLNTSCTGTVKLKGPKSEIVLSKKIIFFYVKEK